MRWFRSSLTPSLVVAVAVFSALNWRAQLQTQQKLDAIAAALAERSAAPTPVPTPGQPPVQIPAPGVVPRELDKVTLPPYVIEAPDVLTVEAVVKDPKTGKAGPFQDQEISGQYLVRPDGTVSLGRWGSVPVAGLTTEQAVAAIRKHLTKFADKELADALTVTVDVVAHNSKRYYVISDADNGEQVVSFPLMGSETVLDAVANVNGLPDVASKGKIWVARPRPTGGAHQILPVDWVAITQRNVTATNYQLFPGDRLYVKRAAD